MSMKREANSEVEATRDDAPWTRKINARDTDWHEVARTKLRRLERSQTTTPSADSYPTNIRSPLAWRMLLHTQACSSWFPKEDKVNQDTGMRHAIDFMVKSAPKTPSLALAMDASVLITLASSGGDIRMLAAGQRMYGDSLSLLRLEISKSSGLPNAALLATIMVLLSSEAHTTMTWSALSWTAHCSGIDAVLNGLQDADKPVGYEQLLTWLFTIYYFWDALLLHKDIDGFFSGDTTLLKTIAQKVPGTLGACDTALNSSNTNDLGQAITGLEGLERDLNAWTTSWSRCIRDSPYNLVSAEKMIFTEADNKKSTNPFPLRFFFTAFVDALDHTICVASLLSVKKALLGIDDSQPTIRSQTNRSRESLSRAITNCADNICMSVPYICGFEFGTFAMNFMVGPLHLATEWYQSRRDHSDSNVSKKLRWCREARNQLRNRGVRTL